MPFYIEYVGVYGERQVVAIHNVTSTDDALCVFRSLYGDSLVVEVRVTEV